MGIIQRAYDRFPSWFKVLLGAVSIPLLIDLVHRYGFWHTLIRILFSPEF